MAGSGLPPHWVRVERISLVRREVREVLAPSGLAALFDHSECVAEGGRDEEGGFAYVTVMVTFDLRESEALFRERADAATARRLAELLREDPRVRDHLISLAQPELRAHVGAKVSRLRVQLEHQVRAEGTRVLLDGDAMVSLAGRQASRR